MCDCCGPCVRCRGLAPASHICVRCGGVTCAVSGMGCGDVTSQAAHCVDSRSDVACQGRACCRASAPDVAGNTKGRMPSSHLPHAAALIHTCHMPPPSSTPATCRRPHPHLPHAAALIHTCHTPPPSSTPAT
eukprot:364218-Chlamydomonas_euryale.AAC.24